MHTCMYTCIHMNTGSACGRVVPLGRYASAGKAERVKTFKPLIDKSLRHKAGAGRLGKNLRYEPRTANAFPAPPGKQPQEPRFC